MFQILNPTLIFATAVLDVSHNRLTYMPIKIACLWPSLNELYVSHNKLTHLPGMHVVVFIMKAKDSSFVYLVHAFGTLFIFRWSRTVEKPPHFGPECKSMALNGPLEARITSQWLEKTRTVSRQALLPKEKLPAVSSNRQYLWRYKQQQQWRQDVATFGYFFRTGTLTSWP